MGGESIAPEGGLREELKETQSPRTYAATITDTPRNMIKVQFDPHSKVATVLIIPGLLKAHHFQIRMSCAVCADIISPPAAAFSCGRCRNSSGQQRAKVCEACLAHLVELEMCFNCWFDIAKQRQDTNQKIYPKRFKLIYRASTEHAAANDPFRTSSPFFPPQTFPILSHRWRWTNDDDIEEID